jgi:hypothetical protein
VPPPLWFPLGPVPMPESRDMSELALTVSPGPSVTRKTSFARPLVLLQSPVLFVR